MKKTKDEKYISCKQSFGAQKIKKQFFSNVMLHSLKVHAYYFPVFIYLETWRGAKLGIFTHFTFKNLPWCSQSMNSLIYVYSMQNPSWSQTWSHFLVLPPPKKVFCITPWWVFVFDLGISTNKGRVSSPANSGNLLEDQEKSRKFDIFWKKSAKSKGRNFYPFKFLTFKKTTCMQKCVQLNCIWQSDVYMMLLFASSIKMI